MKFGLRSRMVLTALAATLTALLVVLVLAGPGLKRRTIARSRETVLAEARLMSLVVEDALARGADASQVDPLVDEAAREIRARATIIALDGRVLADSLLSGTALLSMENHANRPEVVEAVREGSGSALRYSSTRREEMLYAAVRIDHQGRIVGVSRVAFSLADVEAEAAALRTSVLWALGLAFLITAVISIALAAPLSRSLSEIMGAARRFAAGDLRSRIRVTRRDELGELAKILNQAAAQLDERLTEITRDRARTETILTAMEEGVLAVDHRGIILLANDVLQQSLVFAEPVGRHYVEVIRQREVGETIETVLMTGERRTCEVEMIHTQRCYSLTAVPFPGAEGAPHGAVVTFHDVTERRGLERVRRDFVANASHELRTPLTSIRGFVEALEDGATSDPALAERFLSKIRVHADRMASLLDDLLQLSRLESGERPLALTRLDPFVVVEDVVFSFAAAAAKKSIRLDAVNAGATEVVSDADFLRRILENLIDNAIKYAPEGGPVEVTAGPDEAGGVVIEVRDNGPGIAPEHQSRVFERFYRIDKARSREMGGTGLGLAIVKHLCESIGARVSIESAVGQGSRFKIRIPARAIG